MRNLKTVTTALITLGIISVVSCAKDECAYTPFSECVDAICNAIEDFEDDTIGTNLITMANWAGVSVEASIVSQNSSNVLNAFEFASDSWLYNESDFPKNLDSVGCELQYDVQYIPQSSSATTDLSVTVFQGGPPPAVFSNSANFVLNSASLLTSGGPMTTIIVPLEMASGTTLPSNAFGGWFMTGGEPYSPAQIADFNSLMASNNGIALALYQGPNAGNTWVFDNFCIRNCCD
jgi:hypothetical protein